MIICHPKRLIFFKTTKVAGTSFEIALRQFCSDRCVISPISKKDEEICHNLGFRGAQNFEHTTWGNGQKSTKPFRNHTTYGEARRMIPEYIWNNYRKVSIHRNPFDVLVSKYYWIKSHSPDLANTLDDLVIKLPHICRDNVDIAPVYSDIDVFIKFENIQNDLINHNLEYLVSTFKNIRAKGGTRPHDSHDLSRIYSMNPVAKEQVTSLCHDLIEYFNYPIP